MTYSEIRKNEEVLTFIKKGNANLGAMDSPIIRRRIRDWWAERAAEILKNLGIRKKILNL